MVSVGCRFPGILSFICFYFTKKSGFEPKKAKPRVNSWFWLVASPSDSRVQYRCCPLVPVGTTQTNSAQWTFKGKLEIPPRMNKNNPRFLHQLFFYSHKSIRRVYRSSGMHVMYRGVDRLHPSKVNRCRDLSSDLRFLSASVVHMFALGGAFSFTRTDACFD